MGLRALADGACCGRSCFSRHWPASLTALRVGDSLPGAFWELLLRVPKKMPELTEWSGFYVIVGSSAGALIGLQFVVLTLIAQRPRVEPEAGAAFATPSVVHFAVALLLSAVGSAPWHVSSAVAICWAVVGVVGIVYIVAVARRMRTQKVYQPVFEDWLCHVFLPLAAYVMLGVASLLTQYVRAALFMVAAATLLLLFVGIHNAWDAVTFHVFGDGADSRKKDSDSD